MVTVAPADESALFAFKAKLAWFKLSHTLDLWSLLLAIIAVFGVFFTPHALSNFQAIFGVSLVLSMLQKYYAMRVQYDTALFEAWLSVKSPALQMLDDALQAQFGLRPGGAPLHKRVAGLARLFYRQIAVLSLQGLCLAIALVLFFWR